MEQMRITYLISTRVTGQQFTIRLFLPHVLDWVSLNKHTSRARTRVSGKFHLLNFQQVLTNDHDKLV